MKKIKVLLIVVFLLSTGSFFQQVAAQEKTKAEQEKEQKILQEIDQQKKEMTELKKAQAEKEAELKDQQDKLGDIMEDVNVSVDAAVEAGEAVRIYNQRGDRAFRLDEPFIFSTPGVEAFYSHGMGGDNERTTWDFSRSVKENTFSRDYSFDVEKTVNTVIMSVMGDCKAGEIRIKIIMPNGKSYSDILIDEFGNLNWRKSFTISDTENQDKTGEWKFQIASNKATGFFKISLQTY
ncbi:MAG: hypothetical protein NTV31_16030 [Bacteroidia bacterium]|nr:hypothetical protein [Bacteroidia bacterium]